MHRRTGQFSFMGGGCGAEVSCPNIFSVPDNQVVLPKYYIIYFLPENVFFFYYRGKKERQTDRKKERKKEEL